MAEAVSLKRQIACVEREIAMRRRVYPKWVAAARMSVEKSRDEIHVMLAVLETLERAAATLPNPQPKDNLNNVGTQ